LSLSRGRPRLSPARRVSPLPCLWPSRTRLRAVAARLFLLAEIHVDDVGSVTRNNPRRCALFRRIVFGAVVRLVLFLLRNRLELQAEIHRRIDESGYRRERDV